MRTTKYSQHQKIRVLISFTKFKTTEEFIDKIGHGVIFLGDKKWDKQHSTVFI